MRRSIEIKKIDIFSLFKTAFLVCGGVGLALGLIGAMVLLVVGSFGSAFLEEEEVPVGVLTGVLGFIILPVTCTVMYGTFGSIVATIGGVCFNLACRFTGGLGMEMEIHEDSAPSAPETTDYTPVQTV